MIFENCLKLVYIVDLGFSLTWPVQGCAAGQGMVFDLFVLSICGNLAFPAGRIADFLIDFKYFVFKRLRWMQ